MSRVFTPVAREVFRSVPPRPPTWSAFGQAHGSRPLPIVRAGIHPGATATWRSRVLWPNVTRRQRTRAHHEPCAHASGTGIECNRPHILTRLPRHAGSRSRRAAGVSEIRGPRAKPSCRAPWATVSRPVFSAHGRGIRSRRPWPTHEPPPAACMVGMWRMDAPLTSRSADIRHGEHVPGMMRPLQRGGRSAMSGATGLGPGLPREDHPGGRCRRPRHRHDVGGGGSRRQCGWTAASQGDSPIAKRRQKVVHGLDQPANMVTRHLRFGRQPGSWRGNCRPM